MKAAYPFFVIVSLLVVASCTREKDLANWTVEKLEIPLYHSSTADPASGAIAHVEYCAAKLSHGSDVVHIVYRPIDFAERNPGFAEGDTVTIERIAEAKDLGVVDGLDYWIYDIQIAKSTSKPDEGDGK